MPHNEILNNVVDESLRTVETQNSNDEILGELNFVIESEENNLPSCRAEVFSSLLTNEERAEIDSRSIYVGNVDYGSTAKELEQHFRDCGLVNKITILTNKLTGHPKGFAYIEFKSQDTIESALKLDGSMFRERPLKIVVKRTNIHGYCTLNSATRSNETRNQSQNNFINKNVQSIKPHNKFRRPKFQNRNEGGYNSHNNHNDNRNNFEIQRDPINHNNSYHRRSERKYNNENMNQSHFTNVTLYAPKIKRNHRYRPY